MFTALQSIRDDWIKWPDAGRKEEITTAIRQRFGFWPCLGFVDGTTILFEWKPSFNGTCSHGVSNVFDLTDTAQAKSFSIARSHTAFKLRSLATTRNGLSISIVDGRHRLMTPAFTNTLNSSLSPIDFLDTTNSFLPTVHMPSFRLSFPRTRYPQQINLRMKRSTDSSASLGSVLSTALGN